MPLIDDLPPVAVPAPKARKVNGKAYRPTGDSLIDTANAQPIMDVLADLGCLKGKRIVCPGHGEAHKDSSVAIVGNGVKCMHDRCADRGQSGFFNCVDATIAKEGGTPIDAAKRVLNRRGVPLPERPRVNGSHPEPPPAFDDDPELLEHPGASAQPPQVNDGGPWISTSKIFEPLPPPAFAVPELQIGPGRAACFAAFAGAGKTLAAQSLGLSLACEQPIWGWFRHRGPMRVRHADQDQGAGTLRRYQRLARGMGIMPEDLAERLEVSTFPELYLVDTPDDVWLRACDGVGLMILDALRGFMPGIDENDSAIQRYLMRLPKISEHTGCSFLLLHHFGKPQPGAKPELERLRGSSGIGAALGSVFVLTGERGEPKTITHVKSHPEATGGLIDDFVLAIEDVASADGADLHWGMRVMFKTPEQADPPMSAREQIRQVAAAALKVLRDLKTELSERQLRLLVKKDNRLLPLALDFLVEAGSVSATEVGGRGGKHHVYRFVSACDGTRNEAEE